MHVPWPLLAQLALSFSLPSAHLSTFTNKVCGSNLSLVNRNETEVMQISKGRQERAGGREGSLPGRMDNVSCHVCTFGNVCRILALWTWTAQQDAGLSFPPFCSSTASAWDNYNWAFQLHAFRWFFYSPLNQTRLLYSMISLCFILLYIFFWFFCVCSLFVFCIPWSSYFEWSSCSKRPPKSAPSCQYLYSWPDFSESVDLSIHLYSAEWYFEKRDRLMHITQEKNLRRNILTIEIARR